MKIRRADHSDIRRVAELWIHSFPGNRSLAERMHTLETGGLWGGIETVHIAEDGASLAGALKLLPMTQYFGGAGVRTMGLAAVAVSPDARRRGVGAGLCEYALQVSTERGDALSALFPFRPDFYARLGWALVGSLHRYRFRPESLPAVESSVRVAGPEDEAGIRDCYDRVARRGNGLIERAPGTWRRHFDASGVWAFVHGPGVKGYLLVRYGRARSAEQRPLIVQEMVAEDEETYRGLLGWISRQRDLWRRVQYDAPPGERFDLRLDEPRPAGFHPARSLWAPTATILRGPMMRVVDVRTVLEAMRDWPGEGRFGLSVDDPLLERNRGDFVVEWSDGRAQVRTGTTDGPRLRTDIAMLSRLLAGDVTVAEAAAHGARVDGDAATIAAFFAPRADFRLLDVF